ncbi:hypothetical protein BpHYR1_000191 [Brachionus plicatilis]|uniref:Uncharacterized protein n=1 Tax=Brachionus plicatilis TaxID=10195 RepID=A0A3M7P510_BRAPC|nr:hypothetical protein BpHYR1_000191 [Brachionus plicatilis]
MIENRIINYSRVSIENSQSKKKILRSSLIYEKIKKILSNEGFCCITYQHDFPSYFKKLELQKQILEKYSEKFRLTLIELNKKLISRIEKHRFGNMSLIELIRNIIFSQETSLSSFCIYLHDKKLSSNLNCVSPTYNKLLLSINDL